MLYPFAFYLAKYTNILIQTQEFNMPLVTIISKNTLLLLTSNNLTTLHHMRVRMINGYIKAQRLQQNVFIHYNLLSLVVICLRVKTK